MALVFVVLILFSNKLRMSSANTDRASAAAFQFFLARSTGTALATPRNRREAPASSQSLPYPACWNAFLIPVAIIFAMSRRQSEILSFAIFIALRHPFELLGADHQRREIVSEGELDLPSRPERAGEGRSSSPLVST